MAARPKKIETADPAPTSEEPMTDADIAASLIIQQSPTGGENDDEMPSDEDVVEEEEIVEAEDKEPDDEAVEATDEDEADDVDDVEEDVEDEDNETEYLDINDSDLITVMVDGEEEEVSIGDLKAAHAGEGAIKKRLQQATEVRKQAIAEQNQGLEMLAAQEQVLATALNDLDDSLFKGVIGPPDESLRRANPERFLKHQEAYNMDQKRVTDAKTAINQKIEEVATQRQDRLQKFAEQSAAVIAQEIPELANQKTAQKAYSELAGTAKEYGYTDEEIANAIDPRMYMLVRDAMRYRQMVDKSREQDPKDLSQEKRKKVRRLRAGKTKAASKVRQADKQRQAKVARAKQTGKVEDVAATLIR